MKKAYFFIGDRIPSSKNEELRISTSCLLINWSFLIKRLVKSNFGAAWKMVIFRERFLAINTYRLIESYVFTQ